jgi:hypothetical protein
MQGGLQSCNCYRNPIGRSHQILLLILRLVQPAVNPECPTCTITPLTQNPVLEVVKTATVTSNGTTTDVYSFVDIINYTIEVKFGKCDLQIVVTDPLRLNTTIERLAPGGPTPLLVKVTRLPKAT